MAVKILNESNEEHYHNPTSAKSIDTGTEEAVRGVLELLKQKHEYAIGGAVPLTATVYAITKSPQ